MTIETLLTILDKHGIPYEQVKTNAIAAYAYHDGTPEQLEVINGRLYVDGKQGVSLITWLGY